MQGERYIDIGAPARARRGTPVLAASPRDTLTRPAGSSTAPSVTKFPLSSPLDLYSTSGGYRYLQLISPIP